MLTRREPVWRTYAPEVLVETPSFICTLWLAGVVQPVIGLNSTVCEPTDRPLAEEPLGARHRYRRLRRLCQ